MRHTALLLFSLSAAGPALAAPSFSHDLFESVLQAHVDESGLVDYAALKEGRAPLDAYIELLARQSPQSHPPLFPTRAHELAYWINAYNAFVLRGVIDAYPVGSVKDIMLLSGFFNRKEFVAGGEKATLDRIENGIIRPTYKEPRIHFALNCGAMSCPPLARTAYAGERLDTQLEEALRHFARAPRHVRLEGGVLHLSKILEWYGQDFVDWFPKDRPNPPGRPAIANYLLPYLDGQTAAGLDRVQNLKITYTDYDWTLNDTRQKKKKEIPEGDLPGGDR